MSSIGLNSIPTWLKPYNILSNGEKYRASFSKLLSMALNNNKKNNQWILMDEFSSVLDRTNAHCMSSSISKFIRKEKDNSKISSSFILVSTNYDIIPYLQPNLLIELGGDNNIQFIQNPNNKNEYIPDIKVILDLPPFDELKNNRFTLSKNLEFNNNSKLGKSISLNNKIIRLKCRIKKDVHTSYCDNIFDYNFNGTILTDIPCLEKRHIYLDNNNEFDIGIIYGESGCGKTTTGERLFGKIKKIEWNNNKIIGQHFISINDLKEKFNAVSLPIHLSLSYYYLLSNGEKHRVNIARQLGENNIIIDEFTSYIDRINAKKLCINICNYIKKNKNKNIVFITCQDDIIKHLNPSWLFDIQNKKIIHYKPRSLKNNNNNFIRNNKFLINNNNMWKQPKIRIYLKPSYRNDFNPTFSKHHYLSQNIAYSAKCFTAWASFSDEGNRNLKCVGFISIMAFPYRDRKCQNENLRFQYREHRTVILPEYQGLGFGSRIADCIAEYLALHGYRLQSKTAHPRYGIYRDKSPLWGATSANHIKSKRKNWGSKQANKNEKEKMYYSHVYKLPFQRNKTDEKYLKNRIIVKKKYTKHNKAKYHPFNGLK